LRTPWADEKALRSYLSRLVISLEAQIVNSHAPDRDSPAPPASDIIFTGAIEDTDDPFIIVDDAEESDAGSGSQGQQHIYAVWKMSVFLSRPRIRLQGPSAVFSASASLKPDKSAAGHVSGAEGGYLQSGVPSGFNLLDSLGDDLDLGGVKPRLSALRVSRVAPVTHPKDLMTPVRALPSLTLRIFPVVHTRVRFSRPNSVPTSIALIALLEVDFTASFDCKILLKKISLSVAGVAVENLNEVAGTKLPFTCIAHDHVTFLYRLVPQELDPLSKGPTRDLDITIEAVAQVLPGVCIPRLSMAWSTPLDFTLPVNPGFGAARQPIQRSHRPSQLSISGNESLTAPAVSRPDSLPSLEAAATRTEATIPDLGITMTFAGPSTPIYAGDIFSWTVYVVNRSDEKAAATAPRKLALVAIPKRRRNDLRIIRPPSMHGGKRGADTGQVADAVLDENIVHAMQRNSVVDSTDVVCLSADTRIGPLAAGSCHVVELKFLALQEGIVSVEAIRVIDLGSQEHVDVRELPVIVVEARKGNIRSE
jgi:hypothetical protein